MELLAAGKIIVYVGEDEYFALITPEAYHELEKWREYRIHAGEPVTEPLVCSIYRVSVLFIESHLKK